MEPDTTLATQQLAGKKKERLSVALCCNGNGSHIKPLVIGQSAKPPLFQECQSWKPWRMYWYKKKLGWQLFCFRNGYITLINKCKGGKFSFFLITRHVMLLPVLELNNTTIKFLPPLEGDGDIRLNLVVIINNEGIRSSVRRYGPQRRILDITITALWCRDNCIFQGALSEEVCATLVGTIWKRVNYRF